MKNRGQVIPEFMVLSILALLLFFSAFVFYVHEQELIDTVNRNREAQRLGSLLSEELFSAFQLPVGATSRFTHATPLSFTIEVNNQYLRVLDDSQVYYAQRLAVPVGNTSSVWSGEVILERETEGISLAFS